MVSHATDRSARRLIARTLASNPRRLRHSDAVGEAAGQLQAGVPTLPEYFGSACYLHDIGYAPEAELTGFHAIDGARYLRSAGLPEPLVNLVAFHTGAEFEAEERGLAQEMAAFERPDQELIDAVTVCDLTTGPGGERVSPVARVDEILTRYDVGHPVYNAVSRSRSYLMECCRRAKLRFGLPDVWLGASLKEVADS